MSTHPKAPQDAEGAPRSPNFNFLARHHALLVRYAEQAERYLFDDPSTALVKLRQFAELLAQQACAYVGLAVTFADDFVRVLNLLRDRRVATPDVLDLFHAIRRAGNSAVHEGAGTRSDALHHLRVSRQLAVWFHRSFGNDPTFKPGPFVPPPDPAQATTELHEELERLRRQVVDQQRQAEEVRLTARQILLSAEEEARLRARAEQEAKTAYDELNAAASLAAESAAQLESEREQFRQQLAELQARTASNAAEEVQAVVEQAQQAAALIDLDEVATRRIIDQQLRDAGWEADSELLRYGKGVRPQKGRNLAIAEWPTDSGAADYVLFCGLTPLATVEAKKAVKDVPGAVEQAKRYARDFVTDGCELACGSSWGGYRVPFCFATNGRAFLRQTQTRSGIWFLDARISTNHPRPLEG